jgi:hypothetical protein
VLVLIVDVVLVAVLVVVVVAAVAVAVADAVAVVVLLAWKGVVNGSRTKMRLKSTSSDFSEQVCLEANVIKCRYVMCMIVHVCLHTTVVHTAHKSVHVQRIIYFIYGLL